MHKLLILAFIGAIIGWMTNVLAIKLLFRPLKPINIPILNWKLQGLIPKRKADIAKSIGETVAVELVSIEDIFDKFVEDMDKEKVILLLKTKVNEMAATKMPAFVPSSIKEMIGQYIDKAIDEEGDKLIIDLSEMVVHRAKESIDIAELVEDKIMNFELEKLEEIILDIASKELKHIEYLGGLIGFLIGIVQGLIILYI
ncbi:MAG: DUF445 family protein [Firmicutes bacterium]|jgi:uncharacterized membrane protein YheB (UPF0754 family)|nr:DUF445 family protein [Bacillota bacterium]